MKNYLIMLDYYALLTRWDQTFSTNFKDRKLFVAHDLLKDGEVKIKNFFQRREGLNDAHFASVTSLFYKLLILASNKFDADNYVVSSDFLEKELLVSKEKLLFMLTVLNYAGVIFSQFVCASEDEKKLEDLENENVESTSTSEIHDIRTFSNS